jgi:hypothetical protein
LESGATSALPGWMVSSACAAYIIGPPPIAPEALLYFVIC